MFIAKSCMQLFAAGGDTNHVFVKSVKPHVIPCVTACLLLLLLLHMYTLLLFLSLCTAVAAYLLCHALLFYALLLQETSCHVLWCCAVLRCAVLCCASTGTLMLCYAQRLCCAATGVVVPYHAVLCCCRGHHAVRRFVTLGAAVTSVCALSFGPFILTGQLSQVRDVASTCSLECAFCNDKPEEALHHQP